ncbi:MAG: methyltransferase domain-containing protein [Syntrophobacterales bacterium]|nr:methyltransferase domain-containing protein [Syntrophobacterales bacterium]
MGYIKYLKRNLSVPIPRGLKVIDIGSGHAPLIRADVLCDRYPRETVQRPVSGIYMPSGRFVVGDINDLPFINLTFDFSYCSAVLEHLEDPAKACAELSRISRRGLICY